MSKADLGVRMEGGNPEMMKQMVDRGWLGRKTGKGFYLYPKNPKKGDKKQINPEVVTLLNQQLKERGVGKSDLSMEDIQFRIISRFVNEAAFCLQDSIIRAPADGKCYNIFTSLLYNLYVMYVTKIWFLLLLLF